MGKTLRFMLFICHYRRLFYLKIEFTKENIIILWFTGNPAAQVCEEAGNRAVR